MKLLPLLLGLVALFLIGGFAYFAFTDMPVTQSEIVTPIDNQRFFAG